MSIKKGISASMSSHVVLSIKNLLWSRLDTNLRMTRALFKTGISLVKGLLDFYQNRTLKLPQEAVLDISHQL